MTRLFTRLLPLVALALAACGSGTISDPVDSPDAGFEPTPDAGFEPTPDAGFEPAPDAAPPPDTGVEEVVDAGSIPDTGIAPDAGFPPGEIVVETVVQGVNRPWGIEFLPDGRALVTTRPGELRILGTDDQLGAPLSGVPSVYARGQGGLLDVLRSPTFATDGLIFLCYAASDGRGSGSEVARARLDGNRLADVQTIFSVNPKVSSGSNHYGCRLSFDRTGAIMIGVGDRFNQLDQAQVLTNHLGKVMRVRPDGTVPDDNPFVGQAGVPPEIFSYGHRNIQGMAVHPVTRDVWLTEHGPAGGDELNRPQPGANYGWPEACYGSHYDGRDIPDDHAGRGFVEPVHYWTPSIAPSGLHIYGGDLFPEWQGQVFAGALAGQHLARLEMNGDTVLSETRMLDGRGWRIRDVTESPDGSIYVVTDSSNGRIVRITRR